MDGLVNAWNFDRKSKTMQYAYANISLYRSWYAYLREGKRVFSFHFKTKNSQTTILNKSKSKTRNTFQTHFSFLKAIKRGRVSFPKRKKQEAHYMHMHSIFF